MISFSRNGWLRPTEADFLGEKSDRIPTETIESKNLTEICPNFISEDDIAFAHDNVEGIQKDVIDIITNISPLRLHQSETLQAQFFKLRTDYTRDT